VKNFSQALNYYKVARNSNDVRVFNPQKPKEFASNNSNKIQMKNFEILGK